MKDNTKPSGGNLTWEVLFAPWILQRGRGYAEAGRVGDIQQSSYRVHAKVVG